MGGKSAKVYTSQPRIGGFQVTKSSLGYAIPIGWGFNRLSPVLGWYGGFQAIATTTVTKTGGKGGGGKVKQYDTTYAYRADLLLFVGEGPVVAIPKVFKDKNIYTDGGTTALAQAGLSLKTGTAGQSVWPYLETNHPTQAMEYSELAYVYASGYELNDNASMANFSFEVQWSAVVSGTKDANPAVIVEDFLENPRYGVPGWDPTLTGDLTEYSNCCLAYGLLLAPLLEEQRSAREIIKEWMEATNSNFFFSDGVLKVRPYGDEAATGNGATFTPDLTPVYNLTDLDFLDDGEDAVVFTAKNPTDLKNTVQIEYHDRAKNYDRAIMPADDLASIEEYGLIPEPVVVMNSIKEAAVAKKVATLRVQRKQAIDGIYSFRLPWEFSRLEPMDLVSLTSSACGGLTNLLVRIVKISEDEDGELAFEAEPTSVGSGAATAASTGSLVADVVNYASGPGNVATPVIFAPPSSLTQGRREMWMAVAGVSQYWGGAEVWVSTGDANYKRIGVVTQPARYGVTTGSISALADPDVTSSLPVNLTTSKGRLAPAQQSDVDAEATLFLLGSEVMAYRDQTETSLYNHSLSYLRRGRAGTAPAAHSTGETFVRLDEAIMQWEYDPALIGKTVKVKFLSFNVFGQQIQALADVTEYSVVVGQTLLQPLGGWSAVGSTVASSGGSIPALKVTGSVPAGWNPDAVVLEYRKSTSDPWADAGEAPPSVTTRYITGVEDNTAYYVAVSYRWGQYTSGRLILGPFGTGTLYVGGATPAGGAVVFDSSTPGAWSKTITGAGEVDIEIWGGGGGTTYPIEEYTYDPKWGGTYLSGYYQSGGAGGGGYSKKTITGVTAGTVFSGNIGAGGAAGPGQGGVGNSGGATTCPGQSMTANGGTYGTCNTSVGAIPGTGGTASGGSTNTSGRNGGLGSIFDGGGAGNGGGDVTSEGNGTTPGGGGYSSGYAGAPGRVKITFRSS